MDRNIKVTFVMMAYNVENFIEKSVRSVLNQTEKDVVICVRNNGSTDGTKDILDRLVKEDDRVFVTNNRVNGVDNNGFGIFTKEWWCITEELTGEYISVLDADDYLEPDFVEKLYKVAKDNDADITVCGNWFFSEKSGRYSKRLPEPVVTDTLKDIEEIFPSIYNCFRTWWGKLYKASFFLDNFYDAWRWHHPLHWVIDTLVMINYLGMCKKLATVPEPLYNMYVRNSSTYLTRPVDYGIIWGAYAIYNNNIDFIRTNGIASLSNIEFVEKLHWAYIVEGMEGLRNNDNVSVSEKLQFIKAVLNDSIVRTYLPKMFEEIYVKLEPFLNEIERQAGDDTSIYESYIMRLKCFVDSARQDDTSPLNYPLLLGAVFDGNNRNWFGMKFLENPLRGGSQGIKYHLPCKEEGWMYWSENTKDFIEIYCNYRDNTTEVNEMSEEMVKCWNEENYEACYDLVEKVSYMANLNRNAMYYRILLSKHFEQYDIARVLAYTARIIYTYDEDMVTMCNEIINSKNNK